MKCAFGNCGNQHDLWIKPDADSEVVPICNGCAENESEKYHLSYEHSKAVEEVEAYIVAYDPDTALAEQLIDISDELEKAVQQYEGSKQEQIQKLTDAKEKIDDAISEL
ncbi:hypothetical protein EGH24_05965 [Halonotius terrestris]|uniref:Uncharacterized protein n=1 Tax=Halonotius terrestris TaxID=2487750 RepID=A0A8J8PA11_9EURY|nr:hypothetical protein [Halonotius terrestris]TQQ82979.1 hypothetical protein EGH24_05965 [Halonotius terrestris]